MADRKVVVTGIGLACPLGIGVRTVWEGLLAGRSAIDRIKAFDPGRFDCQVAPALELPENITDNTALLRQGR